MRFRNLLSAACVAFFISTPLFAGDLMVMDAYARVASKVAKSGAAFMMIHNHSDQDDRLIAASSDVAKRVELHTHLEENGVMKMTKLEDGMIIPAGAMHALKRGSDHVMFMGLTRSLEHGDMIELTLSFEHAGDVTMKVQVDLER
jgi:copper(I)-binding protein